MAQGMDSAQPAGGAAVAGAPGRLARLGPLAFPLVLALMLFATFTVSRLALMALYRQRLVTVPDYLELLPIGLRMDIVTVACAVAPVALACLVLPPGFVRRVRVLLGAYAAGAVAAALFFELASYGFLDEYDSRPNRLFLEYLHKSREVTTTVLAAYPLLVASTVVLLGAVIYVVWRFGAKIIRSQQPWSWKRRLAVLPLVAGVLALGAWGSLSENPATRATANFSTSHLANELVPNGLYTICCSVLDLRMERSPREFYGDMPQPEMLERVRRWSEIPAESCTNPDLPMLHAPPAPPPAPRPYNLVLLLQESLGAQFVASLGGVPVTPNLERLSKEGLWFAHMYCTGTRTVRGLEATVCGFPPGPSASVVKLGLSQRNFFTIAALLKGQGYTSDYIYGGKANFDNMQHFLMSNGFEHAYDQDDFPSPEFVGTWGVSDEDLMKKADEIFVAHGDTPFFALVLSTSNHVPFEFPDGHIELYDKEKATRNNAVKYADYAIGEMFRRAKQHEYYQRTIWIVVADHDTRAPSDDLIPLTHFHIPALMIGPGIEPQVFEQVASQIDLLPTALHFMGLNSPNPMPGRNVMAMSANDPGRALLQYNNVHGFLTGDDLVVHQPYEAPRQFRVHGDKLEPAPLDPELERDALAHVLLPWALYEQQRYRLP